MTTKEQVAAYFSQIALAQSDVEREKIKRALLKYHYFLPEVEKDIVEVEMEPMMEEIRQKLLPTEPLLQRAEELLNRLKMQKTVLQ